MTEASNKKEAEDNKPTAIEYFNTTNVELAAAIVVKGKILLHRFDVKGRKTSFCFMDSNEVQLIVAAYLNNNLLVPAQLYQQQIKNLKKGLFGKPL